MKNLDSVFEEDAVLMSKTGNSQEALRDDEGKHPSDYSFAGIVEMNMEVCQNSTGTTLSSPASYY